MSHSLTSRLPHQCQACHGPFPKAKKVCHTRTSFHCLRPACPSLSTQFLFPLTASDPYVSKTPLNRCSLALSAILRLASVSSSSFPKSNVPCIDSEAALGCLGGSIDPNHEDTLRFRVAKSSVEHALGNSSVKRFSENTSCGDFSIFESS